MNKRETNIYFHSAQLPIVYMIDKIVELSETDQNIKYHNVAMALLGHHLPWNSYLLAFKESASWVNIGQVQHMMWKCTYKQLVLQN